MHSLAGLGSPVRLGYSGGILGFGLLGRAGILDLDRIPVRENSLIPCFKLIKLLISGEQWGISGNSNYIFVLIKHVLALPP